MMKITFEHGELHQALTRIKGVCGNMNTLPILSCVCIKGESGTAEITGNNLEICIEADIAAAIETEGAVAVSANRLLALVKLLPKSTVVFEKVGDADLQVTTCEGGIYRLTGLDVSEYPPCLEIEGETFTISPDQLQTLLRQTEFAAAIDEVRYTLNTVYFNRNEVVATDGTRYIAKVASPMPIPQFLIPLDAVRELRTLLKGVKTDITVVVGSSLIRFEMQHVRLTSRLVAGEYPAYHKVIPEKYWSSPQQLETDTDPVTHTHRVCVNKSDFVEAIRRVSVFATNKMGLLEIEVSDQKVCLNASDIDSGSSTVSVACTSYSGQDTTTRMGLHAPALLDVISHIESDVVEMEFGDPLSPILFKTDGADEFICMLMPMRLERLEQEPESENA